ncbi:hypothetical protein DB30_02992 [Enhygromyxa salina]|uniref:Uncharacterized protein n=1 Tax=Enhygromyxa salina TaxID=215803 RepID=A0A0C2DDL3_9BACT|nr:hypothetical protein DB30_02992 [Enhygromyxa salina]
MCDRRPGTVRSLPDVVPKRLPFKTIDYSEREQFVGPKAI